MITAHSEGSADRLATLLAEHDVEPIVFVSDWSEFQALPNTGIVPAPAVPTPAAAETEAEPVCKVLCGHLFHRRCITEWLKHDLRCPNCRFDLLHREHT